MSEHIPRPALIAPRGEDIVADIIADAERIEREAQGRGLTDDEAKRVSAAMFLRKIAPYLFD